MDKIDVKTKKIFIALFVLILIAVALTFYRTMILKDYEIFWDDYEEVAGEEIAEE